jgi:hypothetical protein
LYARDPWGPFRTELAAGVVASTIANVNRGKDTEAFRPLDFMPFSQPDKAPEAEPTGKDFLKTFLPPG